MDITKNGITGDGMKHKLQNEPLPEGYVEHMKESKKLIEELYLEDIKDNRIETIDAEINRIKQEREKTQRDKERFVSEIKRGLGVAIKEKPFQVEYVKRPWYYKLLNKIKNVFS